MNQRIAIAVEEAEDNTERIAEHFARCSKFNVFELDENKEIIKNETYFNPLSGHDGGTCQLPGYVNEYNVNVIIAGGMGGKAVSNFHGFGIEVITAPGMLAKEAFENYLNGQISGYNECVGHESDCH